VKSVPPSSYQHYTADPQETTGRPSRPQITGYYNIFHQFLFQANLPLRPSLGKGYVHAGFRSSCIYSVGFCKSAQLTL